MSDSRAEESARRYVKNVAGSIADSIETLGKKYVLSERGIEALATTLSERDAQITQLHRAVGSTTGHQTALQIIGDFKVSRDYLRKELAEVKRISKENGRELDKIRAALSVPEGASAADAVQLLVAEINGLRAGYRSDEDTVKIPASAHRRLLGEHNDLLEAVRTYRDENQRLSSENDKLAAKLTVAQQKIDTIKNAL